MASVTLWRVRDYLYLLSAQSASTLVGGGMSVVFPLMILKLTGSLAAAGLAGVLRTAPYLFLSLPLGALVDRWNRRYIMMACQTGRYVCFFGLGLMAHRGGVNQWHIYVVCIVDGILFVFFNIAEAAALSSVVPSALLPQASSTNEAGAGTAMMLGPAAATLIYQHGGMSGVLFAGAFCYFASFILLKMLRTELNVTRPVVRGPLIADIREGVRWLLRARLVLLLACVMGGLNLINAAMPLLAITLGKHMGADDTAIGTMIACGGVGSVLGALCGTHWLRFHGFGRGVVLAACLHALAFAALFVTTSLPVLGLFYGLIIGCYSLYAVMQFAYRVRAVPEGLQGRVNSACRLIAFSLYPLGSALAGIVSEYWGVKIALAFFTAVALLLACALLQSKSLVTAWHEGSARQRAKK